MSFYKSISKHYKSIFPYNSAQNNFILKHINNTNTSYLLDIGCAIGELANNLSYNFKKIDAIDLDIDMLEIAKQQKVNSNIEFEALNMLQLKDKYDSDTLDAISCFGNTLVHLNSEDEVSDFFNISYSILKEKGKLLIQIINYDRIIDNNINYLPTIENEDIKFIRNYTYNKKDKISFETCLEIKEESKLIKNSIQLLDIRKETINKLLTEAGFKDIEYYGNFKSESLNKESIPLIIVANK